MANLVVGWLVLALALVSSCFLCVRFVYRRCSGLWSFSISSFFRLFFISPSLPCVFFISPSFPTNLHLLNCQGPTIFLLGLEQVLPVDIDWPFLLLSAMSLKIFIHGSNKFSVRFERSSSVEIRWPLPLLSAATLKIFIPRSPTISCPACIKFVPLRSICLSSCSICFLTKDLPSPVGPK